MPTAAAAAAVAVGTAARMVGLWLFPALARGPVAAVAALRCGDGEANSHAHPPPWLLLLLLPLLLVLLVLLLLLLLLLLVMMTMRVHQALGCAPAPLCLQTQRCWRWWCWVCWTRRCWLTRVHPRQPVGLHDLHQSRGSEEHASGGDIVAVAVAVAVAAVAAAAAAEDGD